mgnify:CR=1 FL=1
MTIEGCDYRRFILQYGLKTTKCVELRSNAILLLLNEYNLVYMKKNSEKLNLFDYFTRDVEPLAIQYGMSHDQFWHGDPVLLEIYQRSYYRNVNYTAYINALYFNSAVEIALSNALRSKGQKYKSFSKIVKYVDIFENEENKITRENIEEKYRDLMVRQYQFIASR